MVRTTEVLITTVCGGCGGRSPPQVDKTIALLFAKIALFEALHLPLSFRSGALANTLNLKLIQTLPLTLTPVGGNS